MKITERRIEAFRAQLVEDEKAESTIDGYIRYVRDFEKFLHGGEISKDALIAFKAQLKSKHRAVSGVNTVLAGCNTFLRFAGLEHMCVKPLKIQRQTYYPEEKLLSKEEYMRLVSAAREAGDEKTEMLFLTLAGTGIRVGELPFITVEAAKRGEATVTLKGKTRTVFLVPALREKLVEFAKRNGIETGSVFRDRDGKNLPRMCVWKRLKRFCETAGVEPQKVHPHELRHLFARVFYAEEKDIATLSDILGHGSINTTRIYIMTTGEEHRKKLEKMNLV